MAILVFVETSEGHIKKSSLEAVSYGAQLGTKLGIPTTAVLIGTTPSEDLSTLGKYGAIRVIHVDNDNLKTANIQAYASAVEQVFNKENASVLILPKSSLTDPVAARLAVKLKAAVVSNVTEIPDTSVGFKVKRAIYTGKAFAEVEVKSAKKILVIKKNATIISELGANAIVEKFTANIDSKDLQVVQKEVHKTTGQVLLPEAEIVVSGGRGLKGPENWGLIEELAKTLGAATGCSKPVSDMDWRPHHEHVGQTGVKVSPNLYIAVGISGAIQHLAGVNSSKVIVVINKDSEAPFFKAADYGIVGDAFEILPKLNEAFKAALN